jgi:ribosome maturation factor RimP
MRLMLLTGMVQSGGGAFGVWGMVQGVDIERLIGPVADQLGYELVRVRLMGGARRLTLQIMAERADRRAMRVEDCARLSREISPVLDAADPIPDEYALEVSSPGIDRPLMKPADYTRFAGHTAKIELDQPVDGRKRFQGDIAATDGETVTLDVDGAAVTLPFAQIGSGKLVLTDRLIDAVQIEEHAAAMRAGEPEQAHV